MQLCNDARARTWQHHRRLRRVDFDKRLIDRDGIADGDKPSDDLRLDETLADVGQ
jgi:hypothetical protein